MTKYQAAIFIMIISPQLPTLASTKKIGEMTQLDFYKKAFINKSHSQFFNKNKK